MLCFSSPMLQKNKLDRLLLSSFVKDSSALVLLFYKTIVVRYTIFLRILSRFFLQLTLLVCPRQGILKGEVSLYCLPPV